MEEVFRDWHCMVNYLDDKESFDCFTQIFESKEAKITLGRVFDQSSLRRAWANLEGRFPTVPLNTKGESVVIGVDFGQDGKPTRSCIQTRWGIAQYDESGELISANTGHYVPREYLPPPLPENAKTPGYMESVRFLNPPE